MPPPNEDGGGRDPVLEEALKGVLEIVYRRHPLTSNQILVLAAELQRIGVHKLVEEHIERHRQRQGAGGG